MSKPTPATLREILEHWLPGYKNGSQGEFYTVNQATQSIQEQLKALRPGTAIIDWDDFKSKEEEHEYIGYAKAIEDYEKAIEEWAK